MKKIATIAFVILTSLVLCIFVIKGDKGNPIANQTERNNKFGGPFELSISAGRFALTESIVKYHSLFLTTDLARFSSPDVAEYKGRFISLFTPGISFLGVPFYVVGVPFGLPQFSSYFLNIVLALLNLLLIAKIASFFGIKYRTGLLGGVIFLFATNSLAYTSTFTQHHLTIFLLLLLLLLAFRKITILSGILIGILYGFGIIVDTPNMFLFFPILLFSFVKSMEIQKINEKIKISLKISAIAIAIGILPLLFIFGYYNYTTTGSFTKVAQFIGQTDKFKSHLPASTTNIVASTENVNDKQIGLKLPFKTRSELFGAYILLFSDERSWLYYSPVILLGFLGLMLAYRKSEERNKTLLIIAIILTNIVLYSMFGDPWGGWAFGSRYLLPSAALMCIFLTVAFARYRRNVLFLLIFIFLTAYSLRVSLLGALTTIAIPPKVEAIHLLNPVPYTSQYNLNLINANYTSSLIYHLFLEQFMKVKTFFLIIYSYSAVVIGLLMALIIREKYENK